MDEGYQKVQDSLCGIHSKKIPLAFNLTQADVRLNEMFDSDRMILEPVFGKMGSL